jgi:hypothetical protein
MSEKVELELKIKGGTQAVKTLGQLEQELSNARDAIKEVEVGSDAFKELATKIQNASSEVKTLEKQMEGLEPQQKTEAFLKLGEGIAGGFAIGQASMALLGVESENLEKLQVKVQSAIAIAQGARMISEAALMATTAKRVAVEKLGLITSKIGTAVAYGQAVALGAWATVQGVLTGAIAASSVALKVLKLAIMATGIGALVLAIIAIGVAVYDWATATDETALAQANLNKELVKNNNEFIKNRDLQKQLSEANTQAEKDLVKLQNTLNENTEKLKKNSEGLNTNAEELENLGDYSKEGQKIIKNNSKALEQNSTTIQGNITALDNLIKKKQEEIAQAEEEEETAKQKEADRKQRSSDRRSRRKAEAAELLKLEQELFLMRIEDENERAQAKIELDKQNALEGAIGQEEQIKLIKEKYRLLEEERKQALEDIEFEKLIAKNDKFNEENLKSQEELLAKETAAKEKEAAKQLELDAKVAAFKEGLGNQLFGLAKELGGKNEKLQKSLAIAETAFFTGKSIMRALADIPAPYGVIQAGIHGAMGIAQIANIKSEQIGVDEPDTPDNLEPATTGAFSLGGGLPDQQAVKAYVITDEMSNSQAQLSDIRRRSTI